MNSNHDSLDWRLFINDHPLFGELTKEEISNLLDPANSSPRSFKRDEVIFRAGEISNSFFLIGDGSVRVELSSEDSSATNISTLYKGDYFGEMSAIDEKSGRAATILACEDCSLLEVKSSPFQQILKSNPELEFKLLSMLAERLRHVNDHLLKKTRLSYENKFSILSEKIESQSKVVEASLNASQAVFEQTKLRTSEVINAAERGRSRITWAMSTLTAGFTLLLALFSFLGYDKLDTAEKALEKIQKTVQEIDDVKNNIHESVKGIDDARKSFDTLTAKVKEVDATLAILDTGLSDFKKDLSESKIAKRILFETLIPIFSLQVEKNIRNRNEWDPVDLGGHILQINDNFITINLFKKIFFRIVELNQNRLDNISTLKDPDLNLVEISYLTTFIYNYIHDVDGEKEKNPLAHFLSNYILLITYAMDDKYESPEDNFNRRLEELNTNYTGDEGDRIKRLLHRDFISDLRDIILDENEDLKNRKSLIDEVLSYGN